MTDEPTSDLSRTGDAQAPSPLEAQPGARPPAPRLPAPPPGMAAIALYLLLLAGTIIVGVVSGGRYPPVFLIFSALFIAASGGLLMLFRWAWALALGAAVLLAAYNFWIFSRAHQSAGLVQGTLNLVILLYLIRPEIRSRLH
jgi:hypothetical protein